MSEGYNISDDAITECRRLVKEGLGFNCTFVDDGAAVLVGLAQRAVLAGLASDCTPDMQARFTAASEPHRANHERELGHPIAPASRITDLETALLAATDLAKRLEADRSDMEAVGYALISTLADFCDHPALKNWHPIQCPTEVVGDLLNRIKELEAWIKTIEAIDAERVQHMVQREMAATELVLRIEELEAERDARPAAIEWRPRRCAEEAQELWIGSAGLGEIRRGGDRGEWFWCGPGPMDLTKFSMFYATPEAAKAAVEEALREVQNGP